VLLQILERQLDLERPTSLGKPPSPSVLRRRRKT
jgi:hypothetical protein